MLEKIINSIGKKLRLVLGGTLLAGVTAFISPKSEASIVENLQTAEQPIITMLDYRNGPIISVGHFALYEAQSFRALDGWITDGSLKLVGINDYDHNMYLKIWPDDNGIPDIANELGTTTNELTPIGSELTDIYLSQLGWNAVRVTPGERYWIGLYNPDLNWYGFAQFFSWESGYMDVYPEGCEGRKYRSYSQWEIFDLESRDFAFSVTFSNIPEPSLLTFLASGLGGLSLWRRLKKQNKK